MLNPRLAERYAKSLMDLAREQNKQEAIFKDMEGIHEMSSQSQDFHMLMKSPVIKADKKNEVVKILLEGKVDVLTLAFITLIINKGREFFLPEIAGSYMTQFKKEKNITDVKLTTSEALDEATIANLRSKIEQQLKGKRVDLTLKVEPNLIGGFILEANNNLFDASILRDLNDIKKQFLKNEYVPDIR